MNKSATAEKSESRTSERHRHHAAGHDPSRAHLPPQLALQSRHGNQAVQRLLRARLLQPKLTVSRPNDIYEQEADRVADAVLRMPDPAPGVAGISPPTVQRLCPSCQKDLQRQAPEEEEELKRIATDDNGTGVVSPEVEDSIHALAGRGSVLPESARAFMELRFGHDFSAVRIHTDADAAALARSVNAQAFTVGRDIVFGHGWYHPDTERGRHLLAHELTHTIQQRVSDGRLSRLSVGAAHDQYEQEADRVTERIMLGNTVSELSLQSGSHVQRTIGDGHDLTSPRFSRLLDLEATYDDERVIRKSSLGRGISSGRGVQAIQQALYDLGFPLPASGADGQFGNETEAAVKAFQTANPPLVVDGEVGKNTMAALDARFGAPVLPAPAARSAPWPRACVRSVLCPWSPHTIDVLRTRITLKSFDSISWADEEWDGAAWVPAPFPGGGYNTGVEIGVLNSSCEKMSETLYHEVLHAEQPTRHSTTLEKESYAYRIGEEFSIAMGLTGRPSLRSTDPQGRQFADPTKVGAFVSSTYPSVPAGGGGEEIIGKAGAPGQVRVRRPNGSIYSRPAAVGERVPGPMTTVNEVMYPAAGWTCP